MEVQAKDLIPINDIDFVDKLLNELGDWKEIKIKNSEESQNAINRRNGYNRSVKTSEAKQKAITKDWYQKKKVVDSWFKERLDKARNGVEVLGKAIGDYEIALRNKQAEKQRKINLEIELKKQKELAKLQKEQEKAEKYKREGREDMAQKAEQRAETAQENMSYMVAPQIVREKANGASFVSTYKLIIFDRKEFIRDLVNRGLFEYITISNSDETGLCKKRKNEPDFKLNASIFKEKLITSSRG